MDQSDPRTPALIVHLDILEANIASMASFAKESGVALRPHTKTHKTPAIAHLQMAAGAVGICCATLGEAEAMAAAGLPDILVTRPVVGAEKIGRACGLAKHTRLKLVVDDATVVDQLAAAALTDDVAIDVIMEVDVGLDRCGVEPVSREAVALAKRIAWHQSLRFAGIQGYEGHIVLNPDEAARRDGARKANAAAAETARMIEKEGLPVPTVTGGGTGTHLITGDAKTSGYTEIQPGSYATMDASYTAVLGEHPFGPALGLLTTCVSQSAPGRAVIDAGLKSVSMEHGVPIFRGRPGLVYAYDSEEHGIVRCGADCLKVGEVVELYPGHGCTTFNLHDQVYGVRDGRVEVVWPIAGRGRSW